MSEPDVRPDVVALWLDANLLADLPAGSLAHRDGTLFTAGELDLAWSLTAAEHAAILEVAELRVIEARTACAHERAWLDARQRGEYQDYRRRRRERRRHDRTGPPQPAYRRGP